MKLSKEQSEIFGGIMSALAAEGELAPEHSEAIITTCLATAGGKEAAKQFSKRCYDNLETNHCFKGNKLVVDGDDKSGYAVGFMLLILVADGKICCTRTKIK